LEPPLPTARAGAYPSSSNKEDDLAIIARALPLAPDDHGDTAATASSIVPSERPGR
jgi:hypothetical protein